MVRQHVLLISPPLFGHIIPLLELAKHLVDRGSEVTFVLSYSKLIQIQKRELLTPQYSASISLQGLHDGNDEEYEQDLPSSQRMFDIVSRMEPLVRHLLQSVPVTTKSKDGQTKASPVSTVNVVVTDFSITFAAELCHTRSVLCYVFSPFAANLVRHMLRITSETPATPDQDVAEDEGIVDPVTGLPRLLESVRNFVVSVNTSLQYADAIVINSFRELEEAAVKELTTKLTEIEVPLKFVGPLLPSLAGSSAAPDMTQKRISEWLDQKESRTTIYISFGSMVILKKEQIHQIAAALLDIGKPFIWSLRKQYHQDLPADFDSFARDPFSSKTGLILAWVPQQTVLAHPAISVFVSHNGWNSTLESISYGVPMVCWPMKDDQHINAQSVVEANLGLLIPDTELTNTRIVSKEEIYSAVDKITLDLVSCNGWQENNFFRVSEKYAALARKAPQEGGSSAIDFTDLFAELPS